MTEDEEGRQKRRRWLWLSLAAIVAVLVVLIVPPLVSLGRYKSQITNLMASSLGRPVRLSAVSVRVLPRPEFVLDDLTVEDDPAFGSEPVLHASTVTAPIRLFSLWRGRLEISEVSVDYASVNLVRMPDGRWNLDPLLQRRAPGGQANGANAEKPFPYLAATNSRVNFKSGVEKLPFSIINADLSAWESNPGEWRLRLRGQPVRTDVSLETDTGIVELDATAQRAPELQQVPVRLDVEWRDAQLGQLSRLITGSDAGWRGDLRGEIHVDGTADAAHITTRLRAAGVHRIEFAPAAPMDFDANCSLIYHYSQQAVEKLVCDSPLGDGHLRVTGDVPGGGALPHYSLEMDQVPAGAGLDALRTFRSGVDPGLQAAGTVSGKLDYAATPKGNAVQKGTSRDQRRSAGASSEKKKNSAARNTPAEGPLTGSLTVAGLQFSGGGLSRPLQAPKLVLTPTPAAEGQVQMLAGSVAVPAGAPVPLTMNLRLGLRGYQVTMHGESSVQRGREFAEAMGLKQVKALASLAGEPLNVELDAEGPWLPPDESLPGGIQPGGLAAGAVSGLVSTFGPAVDAGPKADVLNATVTIRNANWKADFLANHVQIEEATLHLEDGEISWDPIDFTYGPLKGTASVTLPKQCDTPEPCPAQTPQLNVQFADLDAAVLQSALLGAREQGTLISDLINRLHPAQASAWPQLNAIVSADSLTLGPVTLDNATAQVRIASTGAEIVALDGKLLGGTLHASGSLTTGDKPAYSLTADFKTLNPVAVGQVLGEAWRQGTLDGSGKIELAGYTGSDLAGSAAGTLHFDWRHGAAGADAPLVLSRFDRWSGDATIADGKIALEQSEVLQGSRKHDVAASVTIADPPKMEFGGVVRAQAKR